MEQVWSIEKTVMRKLAAMIVATAETNHSYKEIMEKSFTTSAEIVAIHLQRTVRKVKYLLIQSFSVQIVKHLTKHTMQNRNQ
jgi:hypothetical protein